MTGTRSSGGRGRRRRDLLRDLDGTLVDTRTNLVVDVRDLLDDLRAGRPFRAHRRNGDECTVEVLAEVLGGVVAERHSRLSPPLLPGVDLPRPARGARRSADRGGVVVPLRSPDGRGGAAGRA
ncbi:hypothetical protein ACIGNX_01175 [Actinosynnema sp. NPDC053489]|uniref:hypothetical protein n=1 Tax=Actinosynnema sp. NPDC053489 TaxID=3363916 RepID=UPI0037C9C26D